MPVRVVGLGQRAAGDDGVGAAVITHLRGRRLPAGVALHEVPSAEALMPLLVGSERVVVVDALLAEPPGQVLTLSVEELSAAPPHRLSSHGLGVPQVIALAQLLEPEGVCRDVRVVAITILRPTTYGEGLSPEVARAAEVAAERILATL